MSDLLPCPFCGSSTDGISNQPYPRDRQGTSWIAACGHPECHAEIEHATADRAIAAWNTRTSPKIDELIEEIEGAIGCTAGDDIRTHIEEALALYRGGE